MGKVNRDSINIINFLFVADKKRDAHIHTTPYEYKTGDLLERNALLIHHAYHRQEIPNVMCKTLKIRVI